MLVELPHPIGIRLRVGRVHVEVVESACAAPSSRPRSHWSSRRESSRAPTTRGIRVGAGARIGRPAAIRRPANDGMSVQCSRPRTIGSICTTAVVGRVRAYPGESLLLVGSGPQRPAKAGSVATIADVLGVPGIHERRRQADGEDDRREQRGHARSHRREGPCQEDRDRHEENLSGAKSDPGCLGDAHEVEQEQAKDDAGAGNPDGPRRRTRQLRRPASEGIRIGPSESASVMIGWCAAMLKRPIWSAEPAPSITLLPHPQRTASMTGRAARACFGTRLQSGQSRWRR